MPLASTASYQRLPERAVVVLEDGCRLFCGALTPQLVWGPDRFGDVWGRHPAIHHEVKMYGKVTPVQRWQQAYGADYRYTGSLNNALPIPRVLAPLLIWAQDILDPRLNGLLLNWYEGPEHYIGQHHDADRDLIPGTPYVTVSFGETRTFRLSKKGHRSCNFEAWNGRVFVMPSDTNKKWKHGVPRSKKNAGRRISVTLRAFQDAALLPEHRYFA